MQMKVIEDNTLNLLSSRRKFVAIPHIHGIGSCYDILDEPKFSYHCPSLLPFVYPHLWRIYIQSVLASLSLSLSLFLLLSFTVGMIAGSSLLRFVCTCRSSCFLTWYRSSSCIADLLRSKESSRT